MKKGFTLVELLVSLVLITILSLALFKTVVNIQEKQIQNIAINKFKAFEVALNSEIEEDFLKDEIKEITECGKNCYNIEYKNKGIVKISIDTDNNTITYGTLKEKIPDDYKLYSDMTITKYESEIEGVNSYIYLDIPINSSLEPSKDGLRYMYVYDKNASNVVGGRTVLDDILERIETLEDKVEEEEGKEITDIDENKFLLDRYPIGSIYISTTNTNPSGLFGGTWVSFGNGRALVGVDTSQSEFNTVEKTGGEKTHTLTTSEIPSHNHTIYGISPGSANSAPAWFALQNDGNFTLWDKNEPVQDTDIWEAEVWKDTETWNSLPKTFKQAHIGKENNNTANTGGGGSHNNLQPYITTYMWKRTA